MSRSVGSRIVPIGAGTSSEGPPSERVKDEAALNPSTSDSRSSRRDATTIGAAILAVVIFGFVALVLASVPIGLAVAVSLGNPA